MTDDDNESLAGWEQTVLRFYRAAVESAGDDGTTRKEALDAVVFLIMPMIAAGQVTVPIEDAIRAAVERADRIDGQRADDVLRSAARGEHSFGTDGDPILDVVVVLGEGRRKTWRHVTRHDLTEMDRLRYRNMRSAADAYDRWRRDFEPWLEVLLRHATLGEAVESGDLPPGDSP